MQEPYLEYILSDEKALLQPERILALLKETAVFLSNPLLRTIIIFYFLIFYPYTRLYHTYKIHYNTKFMICVVVIIFYHFKAIISIEKTFILLH